MNHSIHASLLVVLGAVFGAACGEETKPLDCSFRDDPNNCYQRQLASLRSCLGLAATSTVAGVVGRYNQEKSVCTAPNGNTVQLAPTPQGLNWDYAVTAGGRACLHFTEAFGPGTHEIIVDVEGARYEQSRRDGVERIQCPDGTVFEGTEPISSCPSARGGYAYSNSVFMAPDPLGHGLSDSLKIWACSL